MIEGYLHVFTRTSPKRAKSSVMRRSSCIGLRADWATVHISIYHCCQVRVTGRFEEPVKRISAASYENNDTQSRWGSSKSRPTMALQNYSPGLELSGNGGSRQV